MLIVIQRPYNNLPIVCPASEQITFPRGKGQDAGGLVKVLQELPVYAIPHENSTSVVGLTCDCPLRLPNHATRTPCDQFACLGHGQCAGDTPLNTPREF